MADVRSLHSEDSATREELVTIFSALSDPTRMEMLQMIIRRGEVACAEFDDLFPIAKSTISYHTKILNAAGLIETRRDGRLFFYRPRPETIERVPLLFGAFTDSGNHSAAA